MKLKHAIAIVGGVGLFLSDKLRIINTIKESFLILQTLSAKIPNRKESFLNTSVYKSTV